MNSRTSVVVASLILAVGLIATPALGQAILQIDGVVMETYQPSSASAIQDIRPQVTQRGTGLDGTLRAGSAQGWAINGNPFESWSSAGQPRIGDVWLGSGTYGPMDIDMALPAPGMARWVVGRTYNHRQETSGRAHQTSNGFQGKNWFQSSQPELVYVAGASADGWDVVYIVYGADRFSEFTRTGSSSNEFKGKNGAAGVVKLAAGTPDVLTYYDQHGNKVFFFGVDAGSNAAWQFWKIEDPAGNVAFVGDATTASTAVTNGYNADGTIAVAFDGAPADGRRYTYTYASVASKNRLTQVKAEIKTAGTWSGSPTVVEVGRVDYAYYTADGDAHGKAGDLKLVTITTPLTDSGISNVREKYYRYYDDTWSNSDGRRGTDHMIKMVVGFEGTRNFDYGENGAESPPVFDDGFLTASDADLKPFAETYLEYVSSSDYRVSKVFNSGQCGCAGGSGSGAHTITYTAGGGITVADTYDVAWRYRAAVLLPDGTYFSQYFDEAAQPIHKVVTDGDPAVSYTDMWAWEVIRNGSGQLTQLHSPANNNNSYTHSTGAFSRNSSTGLVTMLDRVTSGDLAGLPQSRGFKVGNSPSTFDLEHRTAYSGRALEINTGVTVVRPMVDSRRAYHTATDSASPNTSANYDAVSMSYDWWSGTNTSVLYIAPKKVTTTQPIATTAKNGSNSAVSTYRYVRKDGTTAFSESAEGYFNYTLYTGGQMVKQIQDCQTNHGSDFASGDDPNTDFGVTESGSGTRLITAYAYDAQGRSDTVTLPSGRIMKNYYSELKDERLVSIGWPRMTSGPTTYFGPASYGVSNHAGRGDFQGLIAITSAGSTAALTDWIDENDADPITALDTGTLARMSTSIHDKPGARVDESRAYYDVPASGVGTNSANYYSTVYGYDDMGRRRRVVAPDLTITRTTFDDLGRSYRTHVGTDDTGDAGGMSGGTNNMVKVTELEFDSAADGGNSYVTKSTAFVEDSTTDRRDTTFQHDVRGRAIVTVSPQSPHTLVQMDNLGRTTAVGGYAVSSGLDPTDNPVTLDTNRITLSRTYFDERGQVYKSTQHQIDKSDGSDDDNLESLTWYDASGRVIKVDGQTLAKTKYDRLDRVTNQYTLAKALASGGGAESDYDTADDVDYDIILEEDQSYIQSSTGNVLMSVSIARHHDDSSSGTAGALDTDADLSLIDYNTGGTPGKIKGRAQISTFFYDTLDRQTDTALRGSNGAPGSFTDYDRDTDSVAPARSDTILVSTTTYNDDGTVYETSDPRSLEIRFTYDEMGRRTKSIANYVNGSPSGATGDDDVTTLSVFGAGNAAGAGQQTKLIADIDGNGEDSGDQVTTYTFGVVKGASAGDSEFSHNGLLYKTVYPEGYGGSAEADRRVRHAYNAQSQEVWREDQTGLIVENDYDTGGRMTQRRVTTMDGASALDTAVRRIATTYNVRGTVDKVQQYDNAAVGSGTLIDEVKYSYDNWGPVTNIEQDHNGAVGAGGSTDDYEVAYAYAKATGGTGVREAVRRTQLKVKHASTDKQTIDYEYLSSTGYTNDANTGRVSRISISSTPIVNYAYNGEAHWLRSSYAVPKAETSTDSTLSGSYRTYPNVDSFNRPTTSSWFYGASGGIEHYDVDIAYDRNSNITSTQDYRMIDPGLGGPGAGARGYDVVYSIDGLNRVKRAQEGVATSGAITTQYRDEQWLDGSGNLALTQTGNWDRTRLNLNGDADFTDTGEWDDTRAHNDVNEITTRNTNSSGGVEHTLVYNKRGDLTDDNQSFKYTYDAFGRLRKVKTLGNALVAEYWYNGMNQRIAWQYDVTNSAGGNPDGTVDGYDPVYHFCYDDRWRLIGTWRGTDTSPKELFVFHAAGLAGMGASSYIDLVVLRDKDANTAWKTASDGTLEERVYILQNWRADVSALVANSGDPVEHIKYSSYGVPYMFTPGDHNKDGAVAKADSDAYAADYTAGNARADMDRDGDEDAADQAIFTASYGSAVPGGRGVLTSCGNRKAYAGYENDGNLVMLDHVKYRVKHAVLGRWLTRDPAGYVGATSLLTYTFDNPIVSVDPLGLTPEGPPYNIAPDDSSNCQTYLTLGSRSLDLNLTAVSPSAYHRSRSWSTFLGIKMRARVLAFDDYLIWSVEANGFKRFVVHGVSWVPNRDEATTSAFVGNYISWDCIEPDTVVYEGPSPGEHQDVQTENNILDYDYTVGAYTNWNISALANGCQQVNLWAKAVHSVRSDPITISYPLPGGIEIELPIGGTSDIISIDTIHLGRWVYCCKCH